jgi:hypothetical protein
VLSTHSLVIVITEHDIHHHEVGSHDAENVEVLKLQ